MGVKTRKRKKGANHMKKRALRKPKESSGVLAAIPEKRTAVERVVFGEPATYKARHALDRVQFWGGISLLMLAVVLFAKGAGTTMFMGAALGGVLAVLIE